MLSLAMAGEGGAGMLPAGPRGAGTALLAAADLLRPSFFLVGRLMLTWSQVEHFVDNLGEK